MLVRKMLYNLCVSLSQCKTSEDNSSEEMLTVLLTVSCEFKPVLTLQEERGKPEFKERKKVQLERTACGIPWNITVFNNFTLMSEVQ